MKYKAVYTPLFMQDVNGVIDYITRKLKNPIAAHDFLDKLEEEILKRIDTPLGYAPYPSAKERPLPCYTLHVKNYGVLCCYWRQDRIPAAIIQPV